jgi:hypothetical protein
VSAEALAWRRRNLAAIVRAARPQARVAANAASDVLAAAEERPGEWHRLNIMELAKAAGLERKTIRVGIGALAEVGAITLRARGAAGGAQDVRINTDWTPPVLESGCDGSSQSGCDRSTKVGATGAESGCDGSTNKRKGKGPPRRRQEAAAAAPFLNRRKPKNSAHTPATPSPADGREDAGEGKARNAAAAPRTSPPAPVAAAPATSPRPGGKAHVHWTERAAHERDPITGLWHAIDGAKP